jgi:hypothetical protein
MERVQLSNLKPWLLPVVVVVLVVVAGLGGYYYTVNRQTTHSLDVDLANQDQSLYSLIQAEGRELVLVEGVVAAIGLEQTENITFPDQYFVTVQNQQLPHALYHISLGPPENPLGVFYPNRQNQPEAVVTKTVSAKELADLLQQDNRVAVELSFPLKQPEIKTAYMADLTEFSQRVSQNSDKAVFEVHYFRTLGCSQPSGGFCMWYEGNCPSWGGNCNDCQAQPEPPTPTPTPNFGRLEGLVRHQRTDGSLNNVRCDGTMYAPQPVIHWRRISNGATGTISYGCGGYANNPFYYGAVRVCRAGHGWRGSGGWLAAGERGYQRPW